MSRVRSLGIVVAALMAFAVGACANVPPQFDDQYVTVVRNSPERMRIVARDADIDPAFPGGHPLQFVLIGGPHHGALSDDLETVSYGASHDAWLEITYVPAAEYVGKDELLMLVVDPLDATSRVATIVIDVVPAHGEGLLAGSWDAEFTFHVQSAEVTAFNQRIVEVYRVGPLTAKGTAQFNMESPGGIATILFDALRFDTDLVLGDFELRSTLAFDPQGGTPAELFDYFGTSIAARLFGVSLNHTLFLTSPQTRSYQVLLLSASVGGVSFSNALRFDLDDACGFLFARDDLQASWSWCDVPFRVSAAFSCDGFESLRFSASEIPVPGLWWLPGALRLDATLRFAVDEKSIDASLAWRPTRGLCFNVLSELSVGGVDGMTVQGVTLYGLVLECRVADGVKVRSATSFDPAKNGQLTGQIDYFESFGLSGELNSCCGIPGAWSVTTYFAQGSAQLFDWGMTLFRAEIGLSEHFSFRFDLAARSGEFGDPTSEFTVGWSVRW